MHQIIITATTQSKPHISATILGSITRHTGRGRCGGLDEAFPSGHGGGRVVISRLGRHRTHSNARLPRKNIVGIDCFIFTAISTVAVKETSLVVAENEFASKDECLNKGVNNYK